MSNRRRGSNARTSGIIVESAGQSVIVATVLFMLSVSTGSRLAGVQTQRRMGCCSRIYSA